jgi:hypothetical protein
VKVMARPYCRLPAAEQRDERAAQHSITSSARASSGVNTSAEQPRC